MKKTLFLALCIAFLFSSCNNENKVESQIEPVSKSWVGTWEREVFQNEGTLEILSVKEDTISFKLSAFSGGHTGEVKDIAKVVNGIATFFQADEFDSCKITFTLKSDSIILIEQLSGTCQAAMGVSYSGEYKSRKYIPKEKTENESLVSIGVLENKEQDDKLKLLVGKEMYINYINTSQLVNNEVADIDSLSCKVITSGVRGLFTFMENIVMIDKANNIWTAVINSEDDKVYYYTNTQKFKDKLPKTIEKWRENFIEKEVILKNK